MNPRLGDVLPYDCEWRNWQKIKLFTYRLSGKESMCQKFCPLNGDEQCGMWKQYLKKQEDGGSSTHWLWLYKWRCCSEVVCLQCVWKWKCGRNVRRKKQVERLLPKNLEEEAGRHLTQWIWKRNDNFPPSHLVHTDLSPVTASHLHLPSRGCGLAPAPAWLGCRWWFSWLDKEGSSLVLGALRTPDLTPIDTDTDAGEKLADTVLGEGLVTLPACTRWGECTEGRPASNCCTKLTDCLSNHLHFYVSYIHSLSSKIDWK